MSGVTGEGGEGEGCGGARDRRYSVAPDRMSSVAGYPLQPLASMGVIGNNLISADMEARFSVSATSRKTMPFSVVDPSKKAA